MSQVSFGLVLQEARERKGLDLQSVARRLRVRPDILRAIENADFSTLPARGYTRNMVAAYARLVGLNSSDITRLYVQQFNSYQTRLNRDEAELDSYASGRRSLSREEGRQEYRRSSRGSSVGSDERRRSSRDRTDDGFDSRNSSRTARIPSSESRTSRRNGAQGHNTSARSRDDFDSTLAVRAARAEGRSSRVGNSNGIGSQLGNMYSGGHNGVAGNSRFIVIAVAVVILVLLVIIFALIFGNRGGSSQQEVAKVPITGVTDTSADGSGTSESEQQEATQVKVPTSVTVEYKLAKGSDAYVIITQDGVETESMMSGPVSETVDVTGTWSLSTYVSDAFTITMDGKTVEFTTDSTSGMPTATVNFEDYLAAWAEEHPDVKVDLPSSSTSSTSSQNQSTDSTSSGSGSTTSTGTTSTSSGTTSTSTGSTTTSSTSSTTGTNVNTSTGSTSVATTSASQ